MTSALAARVIWSHREPRAARVSLSRSRPAGHVEWCVEGCGIDGEAEQAAIAFAVLAVNGAAGKVGAGSWPATDRLAGGGDRYDVDAFEHKNHRVEVMPMVFVRLGRHVDAQRVKSGRADLSHGLVFERECRAT